MTTRIKSVIKITGLTTAVVVGIGVPLGYGLEEFNEAREHVFEQAERSAERVAEYAYGIGPLWSYTVPRLEEILATAINDPHEGRRTILNDKGAVILQQDLSVRTPSLSRRAPIRIGEKAIGWVEAEESLWPLLEEIGLLALVCAVLGIAAFFGFRVLPLRVLDRTFARLEARTNELREQHIISDAA